jgi:hypothetical protein
LHFCRSRAKRLAPATFKIVCKTNPTDGPTLADAKALIARLVPSDRAMLRPWVLAKFAVSGDVQMPIDVIGLQTEINEEHRLRRR